MSTRTEELRYLYRLEIADDATRGLLKAAREQERALAVQEKALKRVGDTSGRVSDKQKAAARTTATAAGLRAREAERAAAREVRSLREVGRGYEQVGREAREAAREQQAAARRAEAAAKKQRDSVRRGLGRAGTPALAAGGALAAAGGFGVTALIGSYVTFEKQMSRVRAVTAANRDEFKQLEATALDLGQKTQFNNREVAAAMTELATAGFDTDRIIKTLPGTLDLAAATGYDLAASAELQVSTLRAFNLEAKDSVKVADLLTNTANKSAVGMDDLGLSLSYIAPVAESFNQNIEDVLAAVGILGNVGLKGEKSGTAIRTALSRLAAPSKQARQALDDLRISSSDLYGPKGMRPLPEIIGKIVKGTEHLSAQERDAALTRLFGREALSGMLKLVDAGEGKYRRFSRELRDSDGAAKKSADVMRDNVAGAWDQFTGSVESAAAALQMKFSPAIQDALTDAGDFVDGLAGAEPSRTITRDAQGRATSVNVKELNEAQKAGKEFAKTLDDITDGAQEVLGPLGKFGGWVVDLGRAHPWLVKTVGGLIALRVAWKAIRITSTATGLTGFLQTLNRVGGRDGVSLGGRIISGIRSRITGAGGVIRGALSRTLGSAGTAAGDLAAAKTAESVADNLPTSVRARRGRLSSAGRIAGGIFAAGAAAVIGVKIGEAIEDALDPKHNQDKFEEWQRSGLPNWLQGIETARQDAADFIRGLIPGNRRGGIIGYATGGVVPALVSSGEEIHHAGRVWTVPGRATAADNVLAMLPVGAGVVTFDGQRRMREGASLGEAIASQAPHFAAGGVVRGKVSTFGPPLEAAGRTATGSSSRFAGVAVRPGATFESGRQYLNGFWQVQIAGRTAVLKQIDLGPHERTGRRIDVTGAGARALHLNPARFPTDEIGTARWLGMSGRGRPVTGDRDLTYQAYRTLDRNRRRMGLLPAAFESGITAGMAGRRTPGILDEIAQAGRVTAQQRTAKPLSSSTSAGGAWTSWQRDRTRAWADAFAQQFGLRITSSHRTPAQNRRAGGVANSFHIRGTRANPRAFDFLPPKQEALTALRGRVRPRVAESMIHDAGSGLHLHVGMFRRGGLVGMRSGGRLAGAVRGATSFDAGALATLDQAIADATETRLLILRARMLREARKGGDERVVKRFQQVVDLINGQLGVRVGHLLSRVERRGASNQFATGLVERRVRQQGLDPAGSQALGLTDELQTRQVIPRLRANLRDAQAAVRKAARAGAGRERMSELEQGVTAALSELDEALVARVELRRDRVRRLAQDRVDDAQFRSDWHTAGLAFQDAAARVQGTTGTSGAMIQRAGLIQQSMPALSAVQTAFQEQAKAALKTGDMAGWRQAMLAAQGAATDLANAQADAADLIKQAAYEQVQSVQDAAAFEQDKADLGLESLSLEQRLAGTFDTTTAKAERASYIRGTILPALQAERDAAQAAVETARREDGESSEQFRQAVLKFLGLQNEFAQEQVEATELVAENTEPLKEFQGSSAFELRGQQWLAGLLGVGSGA